MNLSERIRSCLSSPKTAADVHSIIGGDLALIRGCIQQMVKVGLLQKSGNKKPYTYTVARPLKQKLEGKEMAVALSKSQQIRDYLKAKGPAPNARISEALGMAPKECSKSLSDMKKRGYVTQDAKGLYSYMSDPIDLRNLTNEQRVEVTERNKKAASDRITAIRKAAEAKKKAVVDRKKLSEPPQKITYQSVDDWVKGGGVIQHLKSNWL